jgi:hypothetical protein
MLHWVRRRDVRCIANVKFVICLDYMNCFRPHLVIIELAEIEQ